MIHPDEITLISDIAADVFVTLLRAERRAERLTRDEVRTLLIRAKRRPPQLIGQAIAALQDLEFLEAGPVGTISVPINLRQFSGDEIAQAVRDHVCFENLGG